jgi:predicted transcriptional regulator of viral defense system
MKKTTIMESFESIPKWLEAKAIRGHFVFTKSDLCSAFPNLSLNARKRAISRLIAKKTIVSPWQNFYVIIPMEYKLTGIVPPQFYLDQLMDFLDSEYYVALLNAAEYYGAAHQRPQNYAVFVGKKNLRSGFKAGSEILLYYRKHLPIDYIRKFQTTTGYLNVSSAELTALDLVDSEQEIGGLTRTATVLSELIEEINFTTAHQGVLRFFPVPVVQRLGYLLEVVLDEYEKAERLYALTQQVGLRFRKVALKSSKEINKSLEINRKWKVIVNQEIEIDEI